MRVKISPPKVTGKIKRDEVIGGALQMSHSAKDLSGTPGVPLEKQRVRDPPALCFPLVHAGQVRWGLNSFMALKPPGPSPLGLCCCFKRDDRCEDLVWRLDGGRAYQWSRLLLQLLSFSLPDTFFFLCPAPSSWLLPSSFSSLLPHLLI